jgi:hypothetical protein
MYLFLSFLISFGAKYAGEFFDLPVSGRAQGMGGAYVTLARISESPFWNPACIVKEEGRQLFLFHSESFGGIANYNAVSFAMSDEMQGLGLAIYQIGYSDIIFTNDSVPIDTASVDDWVSYLTYGKRTEVGESATSCLFFGVSAKAIYRRWQVGSAYGVGIDGGVLYKFYPFSLGLYIENLTTTLLFWNIGTKEFIVPLLKTGVSYEVPVERFSGRLILAGGLDTNLENKITKLDAIKSDPHIGIEYSYKDKFAARIGWDKGNVSFGAGIKLGSFTIDYGQSHHPQLGTNSRLSGSVEF